MKTVSRRVLSLLLILALAAGMFAIAPVLAAEVVETPAAAAEPMELEDVEWYYRAFGQSTDIFFNNVSNAPGQNGINYVWVNPDWLDDHGLDNTFVQSEAQIAEALEPDVPVILADGDQVVVESRGGKIANGHDGITFFYTVLPTDRNYVLTADVTKLMYGINPNNENDVTSANGQSGGGMMARDRINDHRQVPAVDGFEELPAISNFAGIRFNASTTGSFYRDGCLDAITAIGVSASGMANTVSQAIGVTETYQLERKDDGFYMTIYAEDGSVLRAETLVTGNADLVQRVEEDNMYWGFFASREARLLVENVSLVDMGEADTVETTPPNNMSYPNPALVRKSRTTTGLEDYTVALRPNYDGTLTVTQDGAEIYSGPVTGYQEVYVDTTLASGANSFVGVFTPDDELAPNLNPVTLSFTVSLTDKASAEWDVIWAAASATGSGDGSSRDNAMLYTAAVTAAEPGQTIYLVDGNYAGLSWTIGSSSGDTNGTLDAPITLQPEPGVDTIKFRTVTLSSSYWHMKGIVAGGTSDSDRVGTPMTISGDYNTIEGCVGEWGTNTGINMGGSGAIRGLWPKYNVFINCVGRYNVDAAGNNADGFAAKRVGPGIEYHGCVAHDNVDDGWDFFSWTDTGSNYPILIDNCVAYDNGHNGFKLGGEMQPADHIVINSLAYGNGMAGYSCNFNPGGIQIIDCVSIDNGDQNYLLRDNIYITPTNVVTNSISYRTDPTVGKDDHISGTAVNSALCVDGISYLNGEALTDDMFASLDRADAFSYDGDGNLVRGDYGRFLPWEDEVIEVEDVVIDGLVLQTVAMGKQLQLNATITPANATDQNLTWTSTNTNYATVEDGVVTGVAPGTVIITATAHNGVSYSMRVKVTAF